MAIDDLNKKLSLASEITNKDYSLGILNASETRYKQIINSITDYIYSVRFDANGAANTIHTPSCLPVTGYTVNEFNAYPSLWINIVHDDDKPKLLDFIRKIDCPGCETIIEHRIWHKCGQLKWIQNTIIIYPNTDGSLLGYDGVISDITERKSAAEQVRLSEEKFRGIFNLSKDAILLCAAGTGKLYDYNQMFLSEFNFSEDQIKGINFDYELPIIEDWAQITAEMRSKNKITDKEVLGNLVNNFRESYILSAKSIRVSENDYLIYQFSNISKRKKLEYILRFIGQKGSLSDGRKFFNDLALFLSDLLGVSHVLIAETDTESQKGHSIVILADGQILDNETFDLRSIPFNKLINKGIYVCESNLDGLFPDSELLSNWHVDSFVGALLNNSEGHASGYIALLNREPLNDYVQIQELLQIVALRVSHELENMHHLAKIAEYREHLEDLVILRTTELESTVQALHVAKKRAESASNAKSNFLSSMSHELRTPLNAILGYASSLQKEQNINDKQKQKLVTVESCGQHLLSIINEILDFNKLDAGKIVIEKHEFNLKILLNSALNMTEQRAKEKQLALLYTEDSILPEIVNGDEKRIRQIILNLISNALKYTNSGSVSIRVKHSLPIKDYFYIEVEDTGAGIAEENFGKIFEPFTQLHLHKTYIEGTGLGLFIVKTVIERMGGIVWVSSKLNVGSTFYIMLPRVVKIS